MLEKAKESDIGEIINIYQTAIEDDAGHSDISTANNSTRRYSVYDSLLQLGKAQRLHYRCTGFSASLYMPAARRDCRCECFWASLYVPGAR